MDQTEMYQKAVLSGDEDLLKDLIKQYGKPRKPISPLIFVLKEDKQKEETENGRSKDDNGRTDD